MFFTKLYNCLIVIKCSNNHQLPVSLSHFIRSHIFYLYISHFIRSHILLLHKKLIFNISGECTIQAPTHYKSGLMLFAFISRAMASCGNCYVVGSRFVECYNQFTSWEHELHNQIIRMTSQLR